MDLSRNLKDIPKLQVSLKTLPEAHWRRRGQKMALKLFHEMAERVPAYKDFLKTQGFDPKQVKSIRDFATIPTIDKDNYLRRYSRDQLCWDGNFSNNNWVISTTSGSTGEPFYFPRTTTQDSHYALTAELYLRENFQIQDRTTLYIDAFAMGAWIGGLFTYEAIKRVAEKGYNLSIITPGIHKQEILSAVTNLGRDFDQVIIACYPPMMKDVLDLGSEQGIDWSSYNLGLVFSAEGFGERFRDHIHSVAGIKDIYKGSLNHYGTVDQGTHGHETPTTTFVRRHASDNQTLFHSIFGPSRKQPTLVQYIPELFYFETKEGNLLCSSYSGIPLVRYDLKDRGGVLSNRQVEKAFDREGHNLNMLLENEGLDLHRWNLPFVYITERDDFSVKLAGGMIYPEEVRKALLDKEIVGRVTGKFTLEVLTDKNQQPRLIIHVELKNNPVADNRLRRTIQKAVLHVLLAENSEYQSNYKYYGRKLWPRIILWPYEHPTHFNGKGKQKWVKKT